MHETPNGESSASYQPADIMGQFVSVEQKVYRPATHLYGIDSDGIRHHVSRDSLAQNADLYDNVEFKTYKPPHHVYGVDAKGTWHHLSHHAVLEHYGYTEHPTPQEDYEARLAEAQAVKDARRREGALAALRGVVIGASVRLATLPGRAFETYKSTSTRNKVMVKVAGAVAIGAAVYLTYRYGFSGPSPATNMPHATGIPSVTEHIPSQIPHVHVPQPPKPHDPEQFSLPAYDARTGAGTIWNTVQRYAGYLGFRHANNTKIEELTSATLKKNGLTWSEARHLPKGFLVHMVGPKSATKLLK